MRWVFKQLGVQVWDGAGMQSRANREEATDTAHSLYCELKCPVLVPVQWSKMQVQVKQAHACPCMCQHARTEGGPTQQILSEFEFPAPEPRCVKQDPANPQYHASDGKQYSEW